MNARGTVAYQFCGSGDMIGGVQDSTNTIAGYMAGEGIETHAFIGTVDDEVAAQQVFSNFAPENLHYLGGKNHFTVANGSQNPLGAWVGKRAIHTLLDATQPDILHINAPWFPHVGGKVLRAAQKELIPTIGTYHIVSEELVTNAALRASAAIDCNSMRRLDTMIAVSEPAQRHMERVYPYYNGDVHIIPNGVDVERYEQAKPFEADEPFEGFDPDSNQTIVFVGRPDPRKGLHELLHAYKLVNRELPDTQLVVCGGNDESIQPYKDTAEQLGISDTTHFMGRVSEEDKARWFASADIAALPAVGGESQGIVLLEAMAAGAGVVVGGNNEGYKSVLNPNDIGNTDLIVVDPSISTTFAEQMKTILHCSAVASDIHVEQQKLVRRKYDIEVVGKQVLDLYRDIV